MQKKFIFIISLIVLNISAADMPKWINDPTKDCGKKNICAVGEGTDRDSASLNANIGISKIFDNQISSNFSSSTGSDGSKIVDTVNEEIKQITKTALQGVQIIKTFNDNGKHFALAALNKAKVRTSLRKEILSVNDKMKALYEDKSTSSLVQLETLFFKRENLEKQYAFLGGPEIEAPYKYSDIFKNKKEATKNIIVHVYLDEDEPKAIEQLLAKEITNLGYKVTRGRTRDVQATHIVTGEVLADKQFLNVEGFEKYSWHIKVSAMTSKKVGTGEMDITITETGRNFTQSYDKAMPKIRSELKEKIIDLKID